MADERVKRKISAKIIDTADVRVNHVNDISSKTEDLAWELATDW